MRGRVVFEAGYAVADLIGAVAAQDRVDQAVELVGELLVGERVLVVAGGNATSATSLRAVVERDGHAVGNAGGIAGGELGVFDDAWCARPGRAGRGRRAARG